MSTLKYDHVMTNMSASPFTSASGYQFKSKREEKQYHTATKRFMKKWYGKIYTSSHRASAYQMGYDNGHSVGHKLGLEEGKAAAMKEAAQKYNYQNTLLKAVEVQAAAMECLTRTVAAISNKSVY